MQWLIVGWYMSKKQRQGRQLRPKAVDPAMKRRRATRHSKFNRDYQKKKDTGAHLRVAIPLSAQKKTYEFLLADIAIAAEFDDSASAQTVVDVLATKVVIPTDLAVSLVKDLVKAGKKIDTKRLTELVHRVILDGAMMSPAEAEMEFLERFGFTVSDVVQSTSGHDSGYEDGVAHGQSIMDWAALIGMSAAATAAVAPPSVAGSAAVIAFVAAPAYAYGLLVKTLAQNSLDEERSGTGTPASEYPDVEGSDSESSARLLLLLAAQFGESVLSNTRRAVDAGRGSHYGAPDDGTTRQLFGVPEFDAYILALARTAIEAATGGHETDPSPLSDGGSTRYVDPDMMAVDPGWNPFAINAMINSAIDRAAVIDTLADRIQVSTGS